MTSLPDNSTYDRVARWLDGEPIELTDAERRLAEEIAADAAAVGPRLDAAPPPGLDERLATRLRAELGRRRGAGLYRRLWPTIAAGAAAAAACWMLAVRNPAAQVPAPPAADPELAVMRFLQTPDVELEARAQFLAEELAEYEVDLALADDWSSDLGLAGLARAVEEMMVDEGDAPAAGDQAEGAL